MKQKRSLWMAIAITIPLFLQAGNFKPIPLEPGKWIQEWLLCGPIPLTIPSQDGAWGHYDGYSTDYLTALGGETALTVKEENRIKVGNKTLKWTYHHAPDSIVNLDDAISKQEPVVGYAYTEIEAPHEGIYQLALGSNDGGTLWVNDRLMWDYSDERGLTPDSNVMPVLLKKGINKVLFKVEEKGNSWRLCLRFFPFNPKALEGKGELFRPKPHKDGRIELSSPYSAALLNNLLHTVTVALVDDRGKVFAQEQFDKDFLRLLKAAAPAYGQFTLNIDMTLANGEKHHQTLTFPAGPRTEYKLLENGTSDYSIVLSPTASESEQFAADELQKAIKEASGAVLPIMITETQPTGPSIMVGYNKNTPPSIIKTIPKKSDESFVYANEGRDIYIIGGSERGTMYGVFSFLEKEMGCRWYTSQVTEIPQRLSWSFTSLYNYEKPGIRVRNDFYYDAFNPFYAAHNRINGSMDLRKQPGGVEGYWSVHTFYPLLPPEEFFKKHPEYYSLIDGKRVSQKAQLCLSNPNVLRIVTERILQKIKENPGYLIYDVSQNDHYGYCTCDKCSAIADREGGQSGLMIWFVNQVAETVGKIHPDKYIGTLAYQYTRKPPTSIRPRENVVVRFCSIECCFCHDFYHCPENADFVKDMERWAQLAPHIYVWDYVVSFSHYLTPFPNFQVLQSNIKAFQRNNAIGIMEQAAYQSPGGELAELRAYVIAKLLWNPDCNVEEVINDFIYGYYGRAGQYIREYFDLLHQLIKPDTHIQISLNPWNSLYTGEFIRKAETIFAKASAVADNDDIVRRVEMAQLPILYLKCNQMPAAARFDGSYEKFCRICEREQITHYAERGEPQRKAFHSMVEAAE